MLKHLCPCCGRRCYLDEPHCERGIEYRETGVIPPRKPKPDGGHAGRKPSEQKMKYRALDLDGKLVWSIREMADTINSLKDEKTGELFACLREEDKADLLMLLEKVRHDWAHKYGRK